MDLLATGLLAAVLVLDTISHLALKGASMAVGDKAGLVYWGLLLRKFRFWIGILAFVVLFVCWLAFLSVVPLAQGVMAGSVTIIGVMLGGRLLFDERITRARGAAIVLIAIGVALVGWGQ